MKHKFGDVWSGHFRGAKYHFNSKKEVWWSAPLKTRREFVIDGHEDIIEKLLEHKPQGGSFRITEEGQVISKEIYQDNEEETEDPDVIFIGEIKECFKFKNVDINPTDLNPGELWPAFYNGAIYHFNSLGKLWWRNNRGIRWFFNREYPKLLKSLLSLKPLGGSFKINECGHVITLLESLPYPENIQRQINNLSSQMKEIIEQNVENVRMVPIYVSKFNEKIELKEPRDLDQKWDASETNTLINKLKNLGSNDRGWQK